jgi:hypothetical protein
MWVNRKRSCGRGRAPIALVLVVCQVALLSSGCLSVRARSNREAASASAGAVAIKVFSNDKMRRGGKPGPHGVLSELEQRRGGTWAPIFRSLNPVWTVAGLPAGSYRVRFPAKLDDEGNIVTLTQDAKKITVRDGRVTDVGVVVVVVAAVLISQYLQDHDLPDLPLPPPEVADAVFFISMDIADASNWTAVSDHAAPVVTSHFPASNALVAARRPRVLYALSEPLRGRELEPDGVVVMGEASGLVPGTVSYDASHWWVVWQPGEDLRPGDVFHVTLKVDSVEDTAGNELAAPSSFTFRTAA